LPVLRPRGNSCYAGPRRVLVRGFDAERSRYADIDDEDRFLLDDSHVSHDPEHRLRVGDLLMLNGQFEGDQETSVCSPGRVIAMGASESKAHLRVWCLIDTHQIWPAYGDGDLFIRRSHLPKHDRELIADLAMAGRPADRSERDDLLALFGLA